MNKRTIFRLASFSGITIGSFVGGVAYERNRCITQLDKSTNPYMIYASDDIKKVIFNSSNSLSLSEDFVFLS